MERNYYYRSELVLCFLWLLLQMNEQDKVLIVHGTWVCDTDNQWIFEPDIVCS